MGRKVENEKQIKEHVEEALSIHFELLKEVPGKNKMLDQGVRIDFMCRAKPEVVERGFCGDWFGIECKFIQVGKTGGMFSRLIWQSITYVQSDFEIAGTSVSPRFVLTASNVEPPLYESGWWGEPAYSVARYGCVGMLLLDRGRRLWNIRFGGHDNYAYKQFGCPVNVQPKHLPKLRVGSL